MPETECNNKSQLEADLEVLPETHGLYCAQFSFITIIMWICTNSKIIEMKWKETVSSSYDLCEMVVINGSILVLFLPEIPDGQRRPGEATGHGSQSQNMNEGLGVSGKLLRDNTVSRGEVDLLK